MKKVLTKSLIEKEQYLKSRFVPAIISTVFGVVIPLLPLIAETPLTKILGVFLCAFLFGIPLGYTFGIKELVWLLEMRNAFKKNTFKITKDTVVKVKHLKDNRKEFQIAFKRFSKETNKYYVTTRRVWRRANVGDEYYLVYVGDIKNVIAVYPLKDYKLDVSLENKLYYILGA